MKLKENVRKKSSDGFNDHYNNGVNATKRFGGLVQLKICPSFIHWHELLYYNYSENMIFLFTDDCTTTLVLEVNVLSQPILMTLGTTRPHRILQHPQI